MAGRVVQVAGDAHALLGGGEPALALGLALGPPGAVLELGDPLPPQPRAIAGEPGRRPHTRTEEELGSEPLPHEVGAEERRDTGGQRSAAQPCIDPVAILGHGIEGNGEADRRSEAVAKPIQGRRRRGHDGEDRQRCQPPRDERHRSQRDEHDRDGVETLAVVVEPAARDGGKREDEHHDGDQAVDEELPAAQRSHSSWKVALLRRRRVAPWEDPCPPWGGRRSSSLGALWRRVARSYRGGMTENTHLVVETQDLGKRYGERILAVDGLNLEVRRGEVYGFLGPNGAGKTTTLRMLLGLIRPTTGRARVLGAAPGTSRALARLGSLIETPTFYPYLSGRDNLRVLARYAGVPEARIATVLEEVDLTRRAGDRFRTYSLGMKQRLGIAAALLKDPELLILDEPTNGMDPAGMAEMRPFIRSLGRDDRTVLLSSHLMGEVEQVCDRVGVISQGSLVGEGTVDELRGREGLWLRAEPLDEAERLLGTLRGVEEVERDDDGLRIAAEPAAAPEINRALVAAGIAVSELRPERASLEKVFLELTNEEEEA